MKKIFILFAVMLFSFAVYGNAEQQIGTFSANSYAPTNAVISFDQLDAATDYTMKIKLTSTNGKIIYKNVLYQVTIASITTNVIYRLQGSLDGVNWFALDSVDITKTADSTYSVNYTGSGQIVFIRLYWVSESGGTSATIDVKAKMYKED